MYMEPYSLNQKTKNNVFSHNNIFIYTTTKDICLSVLFYCNIFYLSIF